MPHSRLRHRSTPALEIHILIQLASLIIRAPQQQSGRVTVRQDGTLAALLKSLCACVPQAASRGLSQQ
ncbi:MAG: hypothetical protein KFH87_11675, partial [Bacteroidetes bacterium]|nr:hypothetical protein [Bacteroidota bacterium]